MRSVFLLTALGLAAGAACAQSAPLQAAGYNPGWALSIDGSNATFSPGLHLQETPPKVTGNVAAPLIKGVARTYEVKTSGGLLSATFSKQACTDAISAIVHPDTVQVRYAGTVYQGCGGDPLSLLQGREWVVEDIAARGVMDRTRITLQFGPKGVLNGRASCNPYDGSYVYTDGAFTLSAAAKPVETKAPPKICSPALRRQDAAFFEVLGAISRWDFTADGAMALGTVDGRRIVARPQ
jgi:heat shock protein HslJ